MKIRTSRGEFEINLPSKSPTSKGEVYIVCPICRPNRKPEHRNEAKLGVNMSKPGNPWRCNVCGEAGYIYKDEDLAHQKIKPLLSHPKWRAPKEKQHEWLEKRGFKAETIDHFNVTISNENVLQIKTDIAENKGKWINTVCLNFPYYQNGLLINVKYRDARKNFKLIAGATKIFYNIDSIKNKKYAIITEGEFDAWSYHQSGLTSVVSVPNGATISQKERDHYDETGQLKVFNPLNLEYLDLNIDLFDHLETIYIATDDDATGVKLQTSNQKL